MREPRRIAVLASGGGTNLQSLIDHFNPAPAPAARVELVVASRAGVGALERAARAGVPSVVLDVRETGPEALGERMMDEMRRHRIDIVVLAGYLQLVPTAVVERYHGRMLNIHPALLPGFGGKGMYGMRVHRAVIESGVRVSGATVHLVSERYDEGRIVAQWPVPVLAGDTPEALAARVLAVEHRILPLAVEVLARGDDAAAVPHGPVCFDLLDAPAPPESSLRATLAEVAEIEEPRE
ncbi:MAG TPA: phosphoribosylglycinamide formyltransferase [Longimicrobium sp.]|nr:phosphoribosylglycinamide formyltransferase [Longimicrobium sp.]